MPRIAAPTGAAEVPESAPELFPIPPTIERPLDTGVSNDPVGPSRLGGLRRSIPGVPDRGPRRITLRTPMGRAVHDR